MARRESQQVRSSSAAPFRYGAVLLDPFRYARRDNPVQGNIDE